MTDLNWPVSDAAGPDSDDVREGTSAVAPPRGQADEDRGAAKVALARDWAARRQSGILLGAVATGLMAAATAFYVWESSGPGQTASAQLPQPAIASIASLPAPNLLKPLTPQEAAKENAERPFVTRPDTAPTPFLLRADSENSERALTCLSQALYYEAAGEGVDGARAVAQVILNRMRHPAYPSSICGVVYQGSERATGCQFSFTCDGSLLRTPPAWQWARSRKIAQEALAGRVFAPVGHATHFHADYVLPYWSDSLDKTVQIGRHIFYRIRSTLGDRRAFRGSYAGTEPVIARAGPALVVTPVAETEQLAEALISDDASKIPAVEVAAVAPSAPLVADASIGTLLADEQGPLIRVAKPKKAAECSDGSGSKAITPLGANDLRASAASSGC